MLQRDELRRYGGVCNTVCAARVFNMLLFGSEHKLFLSECTAFHKSSEHASTGVFGSGARHVSA